MDEKLTIQLEEAESLLLSLEQEETFSLTVGSAGERFPVYEGQTVIVPGDEMQTLQTRNSSVMEDIVVMPIPSNYGLVTYNGRTLTIS